MAQIKDLIVTGASRFLGNIYGTLKGNADTSTKATQDSAGQQINTTYIKGLSVSGRTITYTKGDGKTGTITTQDTNTIYSNATTSANGLMSSSDKSKLDGIATGANKYTHPTSHAATMITQDSTHRFVTDTEKSTWNAKVGLDSNGFIPSSVLPSYVDDVIEGYYNSSKFYKTRSGSSGSYTYSNEIIGETGKIYINLENNKTYRWSGSTYAVISETLALGETSSTAYAGNKGKANANNITNIINGTTKVGKAGNADTVNGLTVQTAVPANAVFTDTIYTHPTSSDNKHIPSGGSAGQILRWSADGTAAWGADNNTTYSANTGIKLNGTTFQHTNSVTAGTAQGDASKTLTFGGTFTIPTVTYDAQGHITGKGTTTMTMPANPNTDTKVTQTVTTSNAAYPLLLAPSGQTTTTTTTSYFDSGVTLNPSTNTIAANISGNAATATNTDKLDGYHFSDLENRYVKKSGDTMTGNLTVPSLNTAFKFNNSDIPEGAENLSSTTTTHTMTLYRNGITIPYQMDNANDGGIIRVRGTSESNCILELGTWDDSGDGETIQFNYYPTTSQTTPTYSVTVPKKSGTIALVGDSDAGFVRKTGDTMSGSLAFANGTSYYISDSADANLRRGLFAGTSNADTAASSFFHTGALEVRESGRVGTAQSSFNYAPRIGFHWSGRIAATLSFHSDGNFYLRKQNGSDRATLDANLNGTATNADTLDSYHLGTGGVPYRYINTINQPTASTSWYLKISTPDWNGDNEIIRVHAVGDNRYGQIIIYSGSRQSNWHAYATGYNGTCCTGIKKVISNCDNVYIRLDSATTSVTIYTTFYPRITTTTDADGYTMIPTEGGLFGNNTTFGRVYGAVWNDYAEYRKTHHEIEPGRCVIEVGDGSLTLAFGRLQPGANIVSDTFGFAIGETETNKTPLAVSGRVLAYPNEPRKSYHPGDPVCSGPNGTISRMTREEVREYPDRIVGTVSEIPEYEIWGTGNVKVNGRIWIKVR